MRCSMEMGIQHKDSPRTCSIEVRMRHGQWYSMDVKHVHIAFTYTSNMQHGDSINMQQGHTTQTRACSMDIRHGPSTAWICNLDMSMDIEHEQVLQHGKQQGYATGTCSSDMQQGHAAGTYILLKTLAFSLCRVDLDSGTGFPVWCGKGREKRKFALFSFALGAFAFCRARFSSRPRALFCFSLASAKKALAHTSVFQI